MTTETNLIAVSPTGSEIVGTADLIPGNALISTWRTVDDFDHQGVTTICWDGQRTTTSGGPADAAGDMLKALKAVREWAAFMGGFEAPCWALVDAAIAKAELPEQDLYVDENGEEWTADQIKLVDPDEADEASLLGAKDQEAAR